MAILNWILSALKLTIVQQKMHGWHERRHDVTCFHQSVMILWHDVVHWITATLYDKTRSDHAMYIHIHNEETDACNIINPCDP